jgi:DNA-binding SARP family transcriptional activator
VDVRVRLFGEFEITCDGVVAIDGAWKPAKAAAIVKILALRPSRSMHRDQLITALWPESDVEAGTNSLYKNLHELRKTIRRAGGPRDIIHLEHPNIALAPYVQVDLDEFRRLASTIGAAPAREDLSEALAVCGEQLLPDNLYEAWTEPYRADVQLQVAGLRTQLAKLHLAASDFDAAIEQYRAILASDDLSEEAHLGLMRAYAAGDRRDLALRQYERCKEVLASELGATPSDDIEAFVEELRRGNPSRRLEATIEDPERAGDAALRRYAYAEAIAAYREAIASVHATDPDDERECELWLKLATATSGIGTAMDVAECCRRAAQLAERAGAHELLARALVHFQNASDSTPNNHAGHREAAELIEAALERLPASEVASRAWLLAAGARAVASGSRSENERYVTGRLSVAGRRDPQIEARLREAVALAREAGSPHVLAYALTRLRTYITSPDTLAERLDLTREMVELIPAARNPVGEMEALLFRHEDLLESGDIDGARIQARAMRRLGESINSGGILAVAFSLLATHETADGPLKDAAHTLRQSREFDEKTGTSSNSQNRFGAQLLALRWHQGRIGEMEAGFRRALDVFPRMMNTRAALAFIYAETGQHDLARAELDKLTEQPVESIPKDFGWWFTTVFMAYAAVAAGERDIARSLYELLRPYADRNAANAGAISFGSAALVPALLAAFLGNSESAESYFQQALAFNIATRQRVWAARTRVHYAAMLRARAAAGDVERAAELERVARADAHEMGLGIFADETVTP